MHIFLLFLFLFYFIFPFSCPVNFYLNQSPTLKIFLERKISKGQNCRYCISSQFFLYQYKSLFSLDLSNFLQEDHCGKFIYQHRHCSGTQARYFNQLLNIVVSFSSSSLHFSCLLLFPYHLLICILSSAICPLSICMKR